MANDNGDKDIIYMVKCPEMTELANRQKCCKP
jgi:hypothetical protein